MAEPTFDSIIIAGERKKLTGGVRVVTYEDPGGFSFPDASANASLPMYSERWFEKKKVKTLEQLQEKVHQVVVHTDLTRDSKMCFDVLAGRSLSTHFMIDWDGVIYQALDPLYQAYHAGDANDASIGLDMNNLMKNLEREPNAEMYNSQHPRFAEMSEKEFKRPKSDRSTVNGARVRSYGYTDPQYLALISLLQALTKWLPKIKPVVPLDEKGEIVKTTLEDGVSFEGILGHWHVSTDRWDPGPGFDWQRVYHGLAREHNAFPVQMAEGVNIHSLLEKKKVEDYASSYFKNNEEAQGGGWFPIGINQTWHGGVHLHATKEAPVFAMFEGVLVAARFGAKPTELGHNNFIVLRHEIKIPTRRKDRSRDFIFYSLYMHLAPLDVLTVGDDTPEWVRQLHKLHSGEAKADEDALAGGRGGDEDEAERPDEEDDDDELFEEEEDTATFAKKPYLEIGQRLAAFKRDQIALIPWDEDPIKISSNEVIGAVGQFGPPDDWTPQIHVEVFAAKGWEQAVDMGVHGRFFSELEGDLGADLFIENREVLNLFEASSSMTQSGSLVPKRVVPPEDIEDMFNATGSYVEEKRWLRKTIARHVSEWSDQVDWVMALSSAEDWDTRVKDFKGVMKRSGIFRDALKQVLPFIWLSRDVATHIGLPTEEWDGVLYHFHPIHFLLWLTYRSSQRIQVISRGLTLRQLKQRRKKEQSAEEKAKHKEEAAGCQLAAIELDDVDVDSFDSMLRDLLEEHDQGEWKLEWESDG